MNREDIIRMAREVGGLDLASHGWTTWVGTQSTDFLERFATLVASAERERIKQANSPEIERINAHIKELEALAQAEQEPVAWKLVPIKPTDEMLKAMDECSTEGYDERLYAGHAASIYMAAVDAAPAQSAQQKPVVWMYQDKSTHEVRFQKHMRGFVDHGATYETPLYTTPPQRTWVGLTDGEVDKMILLMGFPPDWITENAIVKNIVRNLEAKLKEKNI